MESILTAKPTSNRVRRCLWVTTDCAERSDRCSPLQGHLRAPEPVQTVCQRKVPASQQHSAATRPKQPFCSFSSKQRLELRRELLE